MNHENTIREQRTIEAMKKGYMGAEGKLAEIVKKLGNPIYQQGGRYHDQTVLFDPYADEEELSEIDENEGSHIIGWSFDGLSRGIDLSIYFNFYHQEILIKWKGIAVYQEVSGDLESYVPHECWENHIDNLLLTVKRIDRKNRPLEKKKALEEHNRKKKELLDKLRRKWGL